MDKICLIKYLQRCADCPTIMASSITAEEGRVRLTIFRRVILAQITLIILILVVSLYTLSQLHRFARLSTALLTTDAASLEAEKGLLEVFLVQMRSAEKYLLLRDAAFYNHFIAGGREFTGLLEKVAALVDTPQERDLLEQIREAHARYTTSLTTALTPRSAWQQDKTGLSDKITTGINALIRFREQMATRKTVAARDQAVAATTTVGWLSLGGIAVAILCAYFHARGVSRPLQKLAGGLLRVGQGEFHAALDLQAPQEVSTLVQAFNAMAAQLEELDSMKADFLAHVSHELRTPLTGIQEGTALLLERLPGPLTTDQQEILEVVRGHSARLARRIAAILDLAKMEAGMLEYVRVPSDLKAMLEKSVEVVQLVMKKKRLHLDVVCDVPPHVLCCDTVRIQEVLDNVLSNAVKFAPVHGTISLSATLQRHEADRCWVEIRVCDTGRGIPAEDVDRIFEKFYQSSYHRQERQQGTGLGLTIARHIVEAHGGKIWAESQVGEGTTFVVTLPVEANDASALLASPAIEPHGELYAVS